MTECSQCKHFDARALACETEKVHHGADCGQWYPNEQQYTHIEDGDWEHRCERMLDSHIVQFRPEWGTWRVVFRWGMTLVAFCPYCGLELETMAERGEE